MFTNTKIPAGPLRPDHPARVLALRSYGKTGEANQDQGRSRVCKPMTVLAMTGEIGSLGTDVAAGLAAKLGLKIIRSELVADSVAGRLGIKAKAFLRHMDGTASLIERWRIDRRKLVHYASEEIPRLAQQGNVLIKSWGAATPLRDLPQVISVRVCAPIDFRVRVLMHRFGIDAGTARAQIGRCDAARARTMNTYFNVEHEDARLYHLVVNTDRLSVQTCVKTIAELVESREFSDNAVVRSALADKLVEARISSAFAEHISVAMAPLGVSVSVTNGKVTLGGMSCSGGLRQRAETIAGTVAGALQIDNHIVSVPSRGRPSTSSAYNYDCLAHPRLWSETSASHVRVG
jgi:cytidylate kinase